MPGHLTTSVVRRRFRVRAFCAGLTLLVASVSLGTADFARALPHAGEILLEVSLDRYELRVLEDGRLGPRFEIAAGMPSTPTPTGGFRLFEVISNPSFRPGPEALARGGRPHGPSPDGPLGIAKIPFQGSFQIHAGADPLVIGKPITLGCVGLTDDSMRVLLDWLDSRGALARGERSEEGQVHHRFLRPARLRIQ